MILVQWVVLNDTERIYPEVSQTERSRHFHGVFHSLEKTVQTEAIDELTDICSRGRELGDASPTIAKCRVAGGAVGRSVGLEETDHCVIYTIYNDDTGWQEDLRVKPVRSDPSCRP